MQGILIAIEGIDGAGKTTQVELLGDALERAGETVVVSKEPTEGKWGRIIRESARTGRLSLAEEIETLQKDRREHVARLIRPALSEGKTVVLDRYFYSFVAYQGARGADPLQLLADSSYAPVPDLAVLLDIDPRISLARITESRGDDPNHFETVAQLDAVRRVFLETFDGMPNGLVIDASQDVAVVHRTIAARLRDGMISRKRHARESGCNDLLRCTP